MLDESVEMASHYALSARENQNVFNNENPRVRSRASELLQQ
jgi:hypothetical protein